MQVPEWINGLLPKDNAGQHIPVCPADVNPENRKWIIPLNKEQKLSIEYDYVIVDTINKLGLQ